MSRFGELPCAPAQDFVVGGTVLFLAVSGIFGLTIAFVKARRRARTLQPGGRFVPD